VLSCLRANGTGTGTGTGTGKVSFGTEGGLYQNFGIPTIVCGPGSIEQAHKPDEWIEIEQLVAAERFMDRLLDHASHG
jgi:acetylornithine deacetylase